MPEPIGHMTWRQSKTGARPSVGPEKKGVPNVTINRSQLVARLTYLLIALYALTFASLSILQHDSFNTNAFDLGNMDQAVWNTYQGRLFEFSNWDGGTTRLAAHVEPILLIVAQFYRIWSSAKMLLVLQSLVISLGALPAFWLAQTKLRNDFAAVTFASAYLLAPELEAANLSDFHAVSLAAAFLLFAFYFLERDWHVPFLAMVILAMGTKEQIPLYVILLGLYAVFVQKKKRLGYFTAALGLIWFIVAVFVVIPINNPTGASPYLSRYDQLGSSPKEIVLNLILHPVTVIANIFIPVKLAYLNDLFSPVFYLPFFSPTTLLITAPDLAINLLSNFDPMFTGGAHYSTAIIPFIVVSSICGLQRISLLAERVSQQFSRFLIYFLSSAVLISSVYSYYQIVVLPLSDHFPVITSHDELAGEFISMIPNDASVSAGSGLNPHVSQRQRVYLFPDYEKADFIFLDVTATPHPIDVGSLAWRVQSLVGSGQFGILAAKDGYLLLKRGFFNHDMPEQFYSFAKVKDARPQTSLNVTFGNALKLIGYDVHPGEVIHGTEPDSKVTLYWQLTQPTNKDYLIAIFSVADTGEVISSQPYLPTTVWYPTSKWTLGETIQTEALHVPLQQHDSGSVYVGVVDGKDENDISKRLVPYITNNKSPLEVNGDGTLLKLYKMRKG